MKLASLKHSRDGRLVVQRQGSRTASLSMVRIAGVRHCFTKQLRPQSFPRAFLRLGEGNGPDFYVVLVNQEDRGDADLMVVAEIGRNGRNLRNTNYSVASARTPHRPRQQGHLRLAELSPPRRLKSAGRGSPETARMPNNDADACPSLSQRAADPHRPIF